MNSGLAVMGCKCRTPSAAWNSSMIMSAWPASTAPTVTSVMATPRSRAMHSVKMSRGRTCPSSRGSVRARRSAASAASRRWRSARSLSTVPRSHQHLPGGEPLSCRPTRGGKSAGTCGGRAGEDGVRRPGPLATGIAMTHLMAPAVPARPDHFADRRWPERGWGLRPDCPSTPRAAGARGRADGAAGAGSCHPRPRATRDGRAAAVPALRASRRRTARPAPGRPGDRSD